MTARRAAGIDPRNILMALNESAVVERKGHWVLYHVLSNDVPEMRHLGDMVAPGMVPIEELCHPDNGDAFQSFYGIRFAGFDYGSFFMTKEDQARALFDELSSGQRSNREWKFWTGF
ncbi:MAG: hypothetical protein JXR78_07655 [Victivallales bacterium]|nr:hypothetical protein [Victivallales bacterium]